MKDNLLKYTDHKMVLAVGGFCFKLKKNMCFLNDLTHLQHFIHS